MLEHMAGILSILRNGNVNLRWLMLQSSGSHKKLRAAVTLALPETGSLLALLLGIAQLEHEVSCKYQRSAGKSAAHICVLRSKPIPCRQQKEIVVGPGLKCKQFG